MHTCRIALIVLLLISSAHGNAADEPLTANLLKLLFGRHTTPVTTHDTVATLLDRALVNRNVVQSVPVFSDLWLFSDGRRIALANDGIYTRQNSRSSWRAVYRPETEDEAVSLTFDSNEQRGVAYYRSATLTTIDAGLHWDLLNIDSVVENQFGSTDHWTSGVYLNPVTGFGNFVSNCTWFSTEDFGKSWTPSSLEFSDPEQQRKACLATHPHALDTSAGLALVSHRREDYILTRPTTSTQGLKDWQPLCRTGEWVWKVEVKFCGDIALDAAQHQFHEKVSRNWRRTTPYLTDDTINLLMAGAPLPEPSASALRDNGVHRWIAGPGFLAIANTTGKFEFEYRIPPLDAIYPLNGTTALGEFWDRIYASEDAGRIWRLISKPGKPAGVLRQSKINGSVLLYDGEDYRYWNGKESLTLGHLQSEIEDIDNWVPSPDNKHMWVLPHESHYYWISNDSGQTWSEHLLPFPPARIDTDHHAESPWPIAVDCNSGKETFDCAALYEDGYFISWNTGSPEQFQLIATPNLVSTAQFFEGERYSYGEVHLLGPGPLMVYQTEYKTLYLRNENEWTARHANRSYPTPDQTAGGHAILLTEGNEVLRLNETGRQDYFRFSDMQDIRSHCSDGFETIILIDGDKRLSLTFDGGSNWLATTLYQPSSRLSCGVHRQWLWLMTDRMMVVTRGAP